MGFETRKHLFFCYSSADRFKNEQEILNDDELAVHLQLIREVKKEDVRSTDAFCKYDLNGCFLSCSWTGCLLPDRLTDNTD